MKPHLAAICCVIAFLTASAGAEVQTAAELISQAHKYDNMYASGPQTSQPKAVSLYRSALEAQPNDKQRLHILYRMGQLYGSSYQLEKGERPDFDKAIALYKQIIESYPPDEPLVFKATISIGDHCVTKRDFETALKWFKKALDYDTSEMEHQIELIEQRNKRRSLKQTLEKIKRYQRIAVGQVAYSSGLIDPVRADGELREVAARHAGSFIGDRAWELLLQNTEATSELWAPTDDLPFSPPNHAVGAAGPAPSGISQVEVGLGAASDSTREETKSGYLPGPNSAEQPKQGEYSAKQSRAPPPGHISLWITAAGLVILGSAAVIIRRARTAKRDKEISR
jgi:tetratricopeptide (TPR) repeat protein